MEQDGPPTVDPPDGNLSVEASPTGRAARARCTRPACPSTPPGANSAPGMLWRGAALERVVHAPSAPPARSRRRHGCRQSPGVVHHTCPTRPVGRVRCHLAANLVVVGARGVTSWALVRGVTRHRCYHRRPPMVLTVRESLPEFLNCRTGVLYFAIPTDNRHIRGRVGCW